MQVKHGPVRHCNGCALEKGIAQVVVAGKLLGCLPFAGNSWRLLIPGMLAQARNQTLSAVIGCVVQQARLCTSTIHILWRSARND